MIIALLLACTEVSVQNTIDPPEVTLIRPVTGGVFDPLGTVSVCARVEWEGDFANLDAILVSDVDGTLATDFSGCPEGDLGATVTLSDSPHVLALTVTDAANRSATDEVRIVPSDNAAPSCTLASPVPGTTVSDGEAITVQVVPDDPDGDALAIDLESSLDGAVASGSWTHGVASFSPVLTVGSHTLVARVTDPRGASGTCSTSVTVAACLDADGDGVDTCSGDCDDADPSVNPGGTEVANGEDDDCDGTVDEGTELFDDDGDGATELAGDCDDTDASINPGATEIPDDGIDQDCSGTDAAACFADDDDDGHGSAPLISDDPDCTDAGESPTGDDCDDTDASISPSSPEIPSDGIDQDCDGFDPDGCFADTDGDGYGSTTIIDAVDGDCDDPGESGTNDDCNDNLPSVYPGAPELPDSLDNDCDGTTDEGTELYDDDGDTVTELQGDCDDTDAHTYPGAPEVPDDGIDQDCSGTDAVTCYADTDDDGHGAGVLISDDPDCTDAGEAPADDDCDDTDPDISPSAAEIPGDGIDQNCDGLDPDGCFQDLDGDGHGTGTIIDAVDGDCDDPGESGTSDDCNDTLHTVHPGAPELPDLIDNDCDGTIDEGTENYDDDGDGFTELQGDCDDADVHLNPDATEIPDDGIDQDCSGTDAITCFADADGDDYGDGTLISEDLDCTDGGEASVGGDCDDTLASINPGEAEIAGDGIDQDCDGADAALCYADTDGDGYGSATVLPAGDADCDDPGEADVNNDCDDTDVHSFPGGTELPDDGIDQDCSGADTVTCYQDVDSDGFAGDTTILEEGACVVNSAVVEDCDDNAPAVYPGATETADDGVDQDCNGVDAHACYLDGDFDGFGRDLGVLALDGTCDTADNESESNDDCDDTLASVSPAGSEVPDDGIDQDCSGTDSVTCAADTDGDHYGDGSLVSADDDCTDTGEATAAGDCDDTDPLIHPGASEIADDGIDQDCSGSDSATCFVDSDNDGFGLSTTALGEGGCGFQLAELDGDCDDTDPTIRPGVPDTLGDAIDTNCDGVDGVDADGDGFATGPDCDDGDPTVYPGGPEQHDGVDNNCDGVCDEGLIGYGDLVISEVLIDTNASGEPNEYFELYNNSGVEIRFCSGWTFSDQDTESFSVTAPDLVVAPGGFVVFGKTSDLGGVTADYTYSAGMQLGNSGDEIEVYFQGVEIDTLVWPNGFESAGEAQELSMASLDADANDVLSNWCDSTGTLLSGDLGTPGAPNTCP